jgi:hypothetical protein
MLKPSTRQALAALLGRGASFNADGLISFHGADFLNDPRFVDAYKTGVARHGEEVHVEWRVRVALWAAAQGMKLEGDFVECGVNTGILTGAILEYIRWKECGGGRTFYLLDTFDGIPTVGLSSESTNAAREHNHEYHDVFEVVRRHFSKYPNVEIVRGAIPQTLNRVTPQKVAYLSIDLNVPEPEMAAGAHFWPRLAAGACVLLDDYNYSGYLEQRRAWNAFAENRGVDILPLPTGQGLIIKPPGP